MNYTEQDWVDLMRSDPTNAGYMLLFADWLSENGRELEGEAIRLLGETGRVGRWEGLPSTMNGYYSMTNNPMFDRLASCVPTEWYDLQSGIWFGVGADAYHPVNMRRALARVYARRATPEEREEWQRELRGVEVPA